MGDISFIQLKRCRWFILLLLLLLLLLLTACESKQGHVEQRLIDEGTIAKQ